MISCHSIRNYACILRFYKKLTTNKKSERPGYMIPKSIFGTPPLALAFSYPNTNNHIFSDPVIPFTNPFCINKNKIKVGMVAMTIAIICIP